MKESIKARALTEAEYIVNTKATVRDTAKTFDVSERLKHIDISLYREVKKILDFNLSERHLRGGKATKEKYATKR